VSVEPPEAGDVERDSVVEVHRESSITEPDVQCKVESTGVISEVKGQLIPAANKQQVTESEERMEADNAVEPELALQPAQTCADVTNLIAASIAPRHQCSSPEIRASTPRDKVLLDSYYFSC